MHYNKYQPYHSSICHYGANAGKPPMHHCLQEYGSYLGMPIWVPDVGPPPVGVPTVVWQWKMPTVRPITTVCPALCYLGSFATLSFILQVPAHMLPVPLAKRWGIWSVIILHSTRVFIHPTPGLPFKISMHPMHSMVRAAIIEYAQTNPSHCNFK